LRVDTASPTLIAVTCRQRPATVMLRLSADRVIDKEEEIISPMLPAIQLGELGVLSDILPKVLISTEDAHVKKHEHLREQ
jgi:hypothetical protein